MDIYVRLPCGCMCVRGVMFTSLRTPPTEKVAMASCDVLLGWVKLDHAQQVSTTSDAGREFSESWRQRGCDRDDGDLRPS